MVRMLLQVIDLVIARPVTVSCMRLTRPHISCHAIPVSSSFIYFAVTIDIYSVISESNAAFCSQRELYDNLLEKERSCVFLESQLANFLSGLSCSFLQERD